MSKIEIGSEFDSLANDPFLIDIPQKIPSGIFTRSGRDALHLVANDLSNKKIRTIFIPALSCASMNEPFLKYSFKLAHYDSLEDLMRKINSFQNENGIAVLISSYFGKIESLEETLDKLIQTQPNEIKLILDFTHSFLDLFGDLKFLSLFDYSIASIRKWLYLPSGGYLFCREDVDTSHIEKDILFSEFREGALQQKTDYLKAPKESKKRQFREKLEHAELILQDIQDESDVKLISNKSLKIVKQVEWSKIKKVRNTNTIRLFEKIVSSGVKINTIVDKDVIYNKSLLYYPIILTERDWVQSELARRYNIFCPVIWPLHPLAIGISHEADCISSHMLALPCDQRYQEEDMDFIIESLKSIVGK